jgi:hypothetical protein
MDLTDLKSARQASPVGVSRGDMVRITYDKEKIADFCRRNHIRKLSFFGSVIRDDFGPDSDVDVLVECEPGAKLGLFGLARIERELSALLGRKADVNTAGFLNTHFRERVLREAQPAYVSAR